MRNDVFKCFELVFQDPWLSIISSHIINMSKQHRPIEIQFPGRFIGSDSVSRGVAWMLQDSALGPDRDQRGCLQAAGFVWCQGRSNCWGCRMCVLSSTLESLRKETCFFFSDVLVGHVGHSWRTWIMIQKYTAQYLRCIQDLVSASGRGRRREKVFPKQTKRSHRLGRRLALVGPSSARLTARHKLRFQGGLLCVWFGWISQRSL